MSMTPRPPIPSFIPESAPFTPEQRTWLNGLLADYSACRRASRRCPPPRPPSSFPDSSMRPPRRPMKKTARPGTIRPCRSPSA